jgi:hypothetical protein
MYPVQASLKQLQFLYNWSTEVPEGEEKKLHREQKHIEQKRD